MCNQQSVQSSGGKGALQLFLTSFEVHRESLTGELTTNSPQKPNRRLWQVLQAGGLWAYSLNFLCLNDSRSDEENQFLI
jgi:hypothetical protein